MAYNYKYPRPALTTDAVIFSRETDELKILFIQRNNPPFQGYWAFPGGFVNIEETLEHCASRELKEETGLGNIELTQFKTYGAIGRDPRGRTVSVVYYGFANPSEVKIKADDDAGAAQWFPINYLPMLAFDHKEILDDLLSHLHLMK
jgi:8-oxo-dGTP diphosphatase